MLSVTTRGPNNEFGASAFWITAAKNIQSVLYVADEDSIVTNFLLDLIEKPGASGAQVHDANIVATMCRYSLTHIVTHNERDFTRYSPLITILPMVEVD